MFLRDTVSMKLSTLLLTASQAVMAISAAHFARPDASNERWAVNIIGLTSGAPGVRDCYYGAPYGCTKGYCWRTCGSDGERCWLAARGGSGDWLKCSNADECAPGNIGGAGCGKGDCDNCACSC